jgi:hypothetical protein
MDTDDHADADGYTCHHDADIHGGGRCAGARGQSDEQLRHGYDAADRRWH